MDYLQKISQSWITSNIMLRENLFFFENNQYVHIFCKFFSEYSYWNSQDVSSRKFLWFGFEQDLFLSNFKLCCSDGKRVSSLVSYLPGIQRTLVTKIGWGEFFISFFCLVEPEFRADAKTTRSYFLGPTSIHNIMQLSDVWWQYWSKIKKA